MEIDPEGWRDHSISLPLSSYSSLHRSLYAFFSHPSPSALLFFMLNFSISSFLSVFPFPLFPFLNISVLFYISSLFWFHFFQFMPLASIIPFLNTPILLPGIAFPLHLVHFILSLHPLVLLFLWNVQFNVQCNPPAVMLLCQSECGKCVSVQLFVHTVVVVFYCLVILFQFLNVASCNLAGKESKMFPLDKSKTLSIIWV